MVIALDMPICVENGTWWLTMAAERQSMEGRVRIGVFMKTNLWLGRHISYIETVREIVTSHQEHID